MTDPNQAATKQNDPRIVRRARELCALNAGDACGGPGNDCDEWNCDAVAQAACEVRDTSNEPAGDMWRVDVAGYPCSVRGEAAKDHLKSVNRKLVRMKLALHKLAWRDDDAGRVARLALEIDSAAKRAS